MTSIHSISKKVLLCILDGFGINPDSPKNAIVAAKKPNLDYLFQHYPFTTLVAGGEAVGLPSGICGNSEVGHINIGAGRPVRQDLVRINEAISDNTLTDMDEWKKMVAKAKSGNGKIHLMGLLSDGAVHSHISHIKAIITLLSKHPELKLYFHAFMDGRDTPTMNGVKYLKELMALPNFILASVQGRSIAMDRDRRYEKTQLAYETMIGQGKIEKISPTDYITRCYGEKIFDEFITPVLFDSEFKINDRDVMFFVNFRPDRARQISHAFADPKFPHFKNPVLAGHFLCMSPYFEAEELLLPILFNKEKVAETLSYYLSTLGLKQFKIAETEKYAHVTYFFNGGAEKPFPGEEHVLVPSPKEVKTYDEKPSMSALPVVTKLLEAIKGQQYDFYLVNFANADMVGHTGNYQAAIEAIETIDECVGKLMKECQAQNMAMLVTADHGNADQMAFPSGEPHTSHTGAPVPFALFAPSLKDQKLLPQPLPPSEVYALKDIAPTVLEIMGLKKPAAIVGKSVF
jgi:2,3-bisphosphoglycerate-independent phosphoglycerate mutase